MAEFIERGVCGLCVKEMSKEGSKEFNKIFKDHVEHVWLQLGSLSLCLLLVDRYGAVIECTRVSAELVAD